MRYGLGPSVSAAVASPFEWPLHSAAAACDLRKLRRALGVGAPQRGKGKGKEKGEGNNDSEDDDENAKEDGDEELPFVDVDAPLPDGTTALVVASFSG